ncbi:MAG: FtsB family cell division protein [Flavobacteriales bacterium]
MNKLKLFLNRLPIPNILKNKYVLVSILFVIWIAFIDQNSILTHIKLSNDIKEIKKDIEFYNKEIKIDKKILNNLESKNTYERIAREQYLMKRENEDVFVIKKEED